jgi:hypothetical protein
MIAEKMNPAKIKIISAIEYKLPGNYLNPKLLDRKSAFGFGRPVDIGGRCSSYRFLSHDDPSRARNLSTHAPVRGYGS